MLNRIKHWLRDLFRYPAYRPADDSYDEYWTGRDMNALNSFQKARVELISGRLTGGDSVLDIGCGDGRTLAELMRKMPGIRASGIDSSPVAIEQARNRGIAVHQADLREPAKLGSVDAADWVLMLEVLEHMANGETLLAWAVAHARKGVIFSVPNTGFVVHRLRLLLGRFPLQWKAHPSEHLRFWTARDMRWWLRSLGYRFELRAYEGVPVLNRIWPGLFAAGLLVVIRK
jgi:methionine biosynthesis protein MetW